MLCYHVEMRYTSGALPPSIFPSIIPFYTSPQNSFFLHCRLVFVSFSFYLFLYISSVSFSKQNGVEVSGSHCCSLLRVGKAVSCFCRTNCFNCHTWVPAWGHSRDLSCRALTWPREYMTSALTTEGRLPDVITEIDVIDRRRSNIQWRKN